MTNKGAARSFVAVVRGRVQGVQFRHYTLSQARKLGVSGWVRNEANGSVRVVAEARRATLDTFIGFLRRGPNGANVLDVHVVWGKQGGKIDGFCIRR